MNAGYTAALAAGAFILGAVPFSVLIGRLLLKKDITTYGDGNPGATNVWRAGGPVVGMLAVILDVAKGVPFVFTAHAVFDLAGPPIVAIALAAVLGHAFSPFLRWQGGKAIAVTFGIMLGLLPEYDVLLTFIVFMVLGAVFIDNDSWSVILSAAGTLAYITIFNGYSWKPLLMLCLLPVLIIKHLEDLHTLPGFGGRLVRWLQAR